MKTALVFVLLVALYSSLTPEEQYFDKISKIDFGKTIIQTIQLTLSEKQGQETLNKLFELLRKMKDDIESENKSEAQLLQNRHSQCSNQIQEADNQIKVASLKKADYERAYPLIREENLDKQRQVLEKEQEEQRNLDEIVSLTQERAQQKADYETARDELSDMINALQEAKHLISQVKESGFLQISDQVLAQLKEQHKQFQSHMPQKKSFHGLINILFATLQEKSLSNERQAVEKLIAVIDHLIESVYEVQKQEMIADDQREQDFQTQKARLELVNRRLTTKTAEAKVKSEIMKQKLLELENNIATQKQTIENKNQEKNDWKLACQDAQASYDRMGGIRNEELDIIVKVIDILERRVDGVISFIEKIHIH